MRRHTLPLLAFFFFFLLFLPVRAEVLNLNAILDSVGRVRAGGSYGSCGCIGRTENAFIFLTNGHVVSNNKTVTVETFNRGLVSKPLPGTVIFTKFQRGTDSDVAVISVPSKYFGQYPPRIIPLAPPSFKLVSNQYIASGGCPSGEWCKGFEGRAWSGKSGQLYFSGMPQSGQSGSPIVGVVDFGGGRLESRVCGMITWRLGNGIGASLLRAETVGGAIPVHRIHEILGGKSGQSVPISHHPIFWQPKTAAWIEAAINECMAVPY